MLPQVQLGESKSGGQSRFARLGRSIYSEYLNIVYESPEAAIQEGDYSYAVRKAPEGELKKKLEELLAIRKRSSPFSHELLPFSYGIFKPDSFVPSDRKVRVLVQMRDLPSDHSRGHFRNIKKSAKFEVKNVGFYDTADVVLRPGMTLGEVHKKLGDWKPDFFYCHQVEYQCLPVGMHDAPYPVLGHVGDTDLHWTNSKEIFKSFDLLTVVGSYDFWQTRAVTDCPVVVYPKIYGCTPNALVHESLKDRKYDFSFIGEAVDPYRFDTQCFLKELAAVSRSFPIITGCVLSEPDYFEFLRNTKIIPTYVRRWGAFSTRGLEALFSGCCVLYQEEGEFGLYFSKDEGALPYRPDNFIEVAQDALNRWYEIQDCAEAGRRKAAREFILSDVLEQYFEFLSFLAFAIDMHKARRRRIPDEGYRTPALIGGWGGVFADDTIEASKAMYRYTDRLAQKKDQTHTASFLKSQIALSKTGISLDHVRNDMMNCFNAARFLYYAGRESVPFFRQALSLKSLGENLDCLDYLYFPESFDYRGYLDILWRGSSRGVLNSEARQQASRMTQAYSYGYLFKVLQDPEYFWLALEKWESPNLAFFLAQGLSPALEDKVFHSKEASAFLRFTELMEEAVFLQPIRFSILNKPLQRFLSPKSRDEINHLASFFEKANQWRDANNRNNGDSSKPRDSFSSTKKSSTDNALTHIGWHYYYHSRYSKAVSAFSEAIQIYGQDSKKAYPAYLGRGWAYLKERQWDKAVADFERFLNGHHSQIDPNQKQEAFRGRAWAHYHWRRFDKALDDFDSALLFTEAGNQEVLQHIFRGRAWTFFQLGKLNCAIEDFKKSRGYLQSAPHSQLLTRLAYQVIGSRIKQHAIKLKDALKRPNG